MTNFAVFNVQLRELNLTEPFIDYSVVNASAVAQEIAAELSDFFKVRKDALMVSMSVTSVT